MLNYFFIFFRLIIASDHYLPFRIFTHWRSQKLAVTVFVDYPSCGHKGCEHTHACMFGDGLCKCKIVISNISIPELTRRLCWHSIVLMVTFLFPNSSGGIKIWKWNSSSLVSRDTDNDTYWHSLSAWKLFWAAVCSLDCAKSKLN